MSAFFEPPPPSREKPEHVAPPWLGPPEDVIGEAAGKPFVLARTDPSRSPYGGSRPSLPGSPSR